MSGWVRRFGGGCFLFLIVWFFVGVYVLFLLGLWVCWCGCLGDEVWGVFGVFGVWVVGVRVKGEVGGGVWGVWGGVM